MRTLSPVLFLPVLVALVFGLHLACRQPPEPPRGVDENPPVEKIVEETVEPTPESARVWVENDWLAVIEVRLAPGARLTFHRDGARIAYAHTECSLSIPPRSEAEHPSVRSFRAGKAGRLPSGALTVENGGVAEARFVVVTRSSQPPPPGAGAGPGLAGATGARELFRDREVAVHALTLDAGGARSVSDAPLEWIQVLGPGELRIEAQETPEPVSEPMSPGTGPVHVVAGAYRISNPGAQPVRLVVFRFQP